MRRWIISWAGRFRATLDRQNKPVLCHSAPPPLCGKTVEPLWAALLSAARRLKPFGVLIRYPGNDATKAQARRALTDAKTIREEVRLSLGLKV